MQINRLPTKGNSDWLFCNAEGERLKYIHQAWDRLRKKAGLPHLRLHDLRHQYASMLINSGYSLYVVQNALRHRSSSTTERYAHLSTKTLQDAADSVSVTLQGAVRRSA